MTGLRRSLWAAALAAALACEPTAAARAQAEQREQAEELAREAVEKFMRALELLIESIPQFELPEFTDEGDIIIRRRRGPEPPEPAPKRDLAPEDSVRT